MHQSFDLTKKELIRLIKARTELQHNSLVLIIDQSHHKIKSEK